MHHANKKKERRKKCPRTGVYSDKGRLPGSTFFPAREELVGVLLSENPSIHYDIYTSTYIQSTPKALWYTGVYIICTVKPRYLDLDGGWLKTSRYPSISRYQQ